MTESTWQEKLSDLQRNRFAPEPSVVTTQEDDTRVNYQDQSYSQNDLVQDEYYDTIKDYMAIRFGVDEFREYTKEDVVNKFLNNMRGFSGGNSIRAINEIAFLNSYDSDDEDDAEHLALAGKAYDMYENLESVFGDTTIGEKTEIVGDFAREAILDPVNLIGFGIGKAFTAGATKASAKIAQRTAMQLYKKKLSQGVSKEAAEKIAQKLFERKLKAVTTEVNTTTIKNNIKKNSTKGFKALGTREGLKEVGAITTIDTIAAVGTEVAYQSALVRTNVQEDINMYSVGIAAIGSIVLGGGAGVASVLLSRTGKKPDGTGSLSLPNVDVTKPKELTFKSLEEGGTSLKAITDSLDAHIKSVGGKTSWLKKVNAGKNIAVGGYADKFFIDMILGNKDMGMTGLAEVMAKNGYTWSPRFTGDKITNFMADVIKKSDPQDIKSFFKAYEEVTGLEMYTSEVAEGVNKRLSEFTAEDFSNALANWASNAGTKLNSLSQAANILGEKRIPDDFTLSEYSQALFDTGIAEIKPKEGILYKGLGSKFEGVDAPSFLGDAVKSNQNRIIRLLVSSPSTSMLNLVGWGSATTFNSATDVGLGLIFAGKAGMQRLIASDNYKESSRIASAYFQANKRRMRNLLDPNMTYDAFRSISEKHPELLKELTAVLPGGVANVDKLMKQKGFDPNMTVGGELAERATDAIQYASFVKMQDVFTKSQEFTYQLDKNLRLAFNKGWDEFYKADNASVLMNTKEYKVAVGKASEETQRAIFSKSYADKTNLGQVAKLIEEARNIPGVGLLVPFGRFFNNTIAFSMDVTGVSYGTKLLGFQKGRGSKELFVRGTVGLGLMYSLMQDEYLYREMGLAYDQRPNTLKLPTSVLPFVDDNLEIARGTGAIKTEKYNFPYSHLKAGARLASYFAEGQRPPDEEIRQITKEIGLSQLTRQLDQTLDGFGKAIEDGLAGDIGFWDAVGGSFAQVGSQAFSGSTRFLDPYNSLVGLARGDSYKSINRKDGSRIVNDSLRYMDQVLAVITGKDLAGEKFTASVGDIRSDASKQLGIREVELTDTSKMFNMIGRPNYLADEKTKTQRAGNRYNQVFHKILEEESSKVIRSTGFRQGVKYNFGKSLTTSKLEIRRLAVEEAIKKSKELTKTLMGVGLTDLGDVQVRTLLRLEDKYTLPVLEKALKELDKDGKLEELNNSQLKALEGSLQFKEVIDKINI